MNKNFDIYSVDWCNIVFDGKNQKYGAYQLRHQSWKRHRIALFSVIIIFIIALMIPGFLKTVMPEKKERMVEVTSLTDLQIEQPMLKEEVIIPPSNTPLKSSVRFTLPEIKQDEEVDPADEIKTQDELNETDVAISVADVMGNDEEKGKDVADAIRNMHITGENGVYKLVDQMPEFPGGEAAMRRWIAEHLRYPKSAQSKGITGIVYITFIVDTEGKVTKVAVESGADPSLDKEALRVVNNLPAWTPGKLAGNLVSVMFTIPISFELQ